MGLSLALGEVIGLHGISFKDCRAKMLGQRYTSY
jgi:hypothetical protein